MKNKIGDLRNLMFQTIEGLLDPEKPLEIERARAVADVAKVLVDTARVEVEALKAAKALQDELRFVRGAEVGSGFMQLRLDDGKSNGDGARG